MRIFNFTDKMEHPDDLWRIQIDLDPPYAKKFKLSSTVSKLLILVEQEEASLYITVQPNIPGHQQYRRKYVCVQGLNVICLCRHKKTNPISPRFNKITLFLSQVSYQEPIYVYYPTNIYLSTWITKDIFQTNSTTCNLSVVTAPTHVLSSLAWNVKQQFAHSQVPNDVFKEYTEGKMLYDPQIKQISLNAYQELLLDASPTNCERIFRYRGHRYPLSSIQTKIPFSAPRMTELMQLSDLSSILFSEYNPRPVADNIYSDQDSDDSTFDETSESDTE